MVKKISALLLTLLLISALTVTALAHPVPDLSTNGSLTFVMDYNDEPLDNGKLNLYKVGEIVGEIVPPETKPGAFIQLNLRKLAHFTEFFVLGAEISLYALFFIKKLSISVLCYPIGIILAFFDETIQIFSKRGPQISDVWLDFLGYSISMTLVYLTYLLVVRISRKSHAEKMR